MNTDKTQEEVIKENLVNSISLIKDLSRNLNLKDSYLEYAIEQFGKPEAEMSIAELALLNEMLIGACLKQIA
jgi:hypothetical protein